MLTRGADAVVSVLALYPLLFMLHVDVSWVPYLLSVGSFIGALVIRRWVLKPMARAEDTAAHSAADESHGLVVGKVGIGL